MPLDPAATIKLDKTILERFPVGYRHLAYLQMKGGFNVKPDFPAPTGPRSTRCTPRARTG